MLLPSRKPSFLYSLLKFVYVISRLVLHPLLRKILDPPLHPKQRAVSLKQQNPCDSPLVLAWRHFQSQLLGAYATPLATVAIEEVDWVYLTP